MLISALGHILRHIVTKLALHPVDLVARLDCITAPEQPRQSRMADRNMQPVGVIVGDRLPVKIARAKRHAANRAQFLEPVQRHLILVRRHHFCDRRCTSLKRDKHKTMPLLDRNRHKSQLVRGETRVFGTMRYADKPPVARIAPCMVRASQHPGAPSPAVDQPRPAMAADIGERAHRAVIASDHDHAFAKIIETAPVARLGDIAGMTHHLRRRAKEGAFLGGKKFLVMVKPAGQAHSVERVGRRGGAAKRGGHARHLPSSAICGNSAPA